MKFWLAILLSTTLVTACAKTAIRKPAKEVFREFRNEIEYLRELEAKHIRPAALVQISSENDYTLYVTGKGLEVTSDRRRPYPDRKILQQYQEVVKAIGAHCVAFYDDGSFRIVFMNEEFAPPDEDGLIYQPDPNAVQSPRYPSHLEYLGEGWYSYTLAEVGKRALKR